MNLLCPPFVAERPLGLNLLQRPLQRHLRREPRLVVLAHLEDRADETLDAEPGMLPGTIGWDHTAGALPRSD